MEHKLTKYAFRVTSAILISRILGYIRDMLVALVFGAGFVTDAFYAAFRLPNLFRRLFGEGALSASYIPIFSEYVHQKTDDPANTESRNFFQVVITTLFLILLILTILGILWAPQITSLLAFGFQSTPGKLELTVLLTRITFPYLLFVCLSALVMATLNTLGVFFLPAFSSTMLSIMEILYLGIAIIAVKSHILWLAVFAVIGGLCQLLIQLPSLYRRNFTLKFTFNPHHSGLIKLSRLIFPAMVGFSVEQINSFIDTICGSFLQEGSVSALYYANRIMQLPLALFGISVATVSLPLMSKTTAEKNIGQLKEILSSSLNMVIWIIIPSSVGLIVLGEPIVRTLFERGAFDFTATKLTTQALIYYSLGLAAFSSVKIIASAFYSLKDTATPVKIGILCLCVNLILNLILMDSLQVGGLALATTLSSGLNLTILGMILYKRIGTFTHGLKQVLVHTLFASIIMAIVCYFMFYLLRTRTVLSIAIPILLSTGLYLLISYRLNIAGSRTLITKIYRKFLNH